MSSTSITATWVTLRPWIWLCATSAEYFIAIINIIVWGSQNTCISQVLFCHTHARGNLVFAEGFLAPIQTPVVCLFPHSKQPNSLYLSFQLEFLGQIWCRLVCFPVLFTTEAESATEYTIFIPSHTNDKSRTPPLSVFFYFLFSLSLMTKALHPCKCIVVCVSTHVHTHACITKWLMQPTWPAGDFPGCSGVAQCVTWPPSEGGAAQLSSRFGWQTRCVLACCWKCDSPRPTWRTKKKMELISTLALL